MKKLTTPSHYTFHNQYGQTFQLRSDLTVDDLAKMGYRDIRLVTTESPLKSFEWRLNPMYKSPENND